MPSLKETLSVNIKRLLEQQKMSQTDLAKKLETSFQTVNAYVKGRTGVSTDMISKLAQVFRVEETELTSPPKGIGPGWTPKDTDTMNQLLKTMKDWKAIREDPSIDPEVAEAASLFASLDEMQRDMILRLLRGAAGVADSQKKKQE